MGFLDKLLRRDTGDDDGPVQLSPFSSESVQPALSDLIEALEALIDAMDSDARNSCACGPSTAALRRRTSPTSHRSTIG